MSGLVSLADILDSEEFTPDDGDFVQVNTIWTSGLINTKEGKKISKYIFADKDGRHIGGVLWWNDNDVANANNVHRILQQHSCWFQIFKFTVEKIESENWCDIRGQSRQIKISKSSLNVRKCEAQVPMHKHLPFQFTMLEDIDACTIGTTVDVIGFATHLTRKLKSKDGKTDYKNVTIASTATKNDSSSAMRKITIFENCFKHITAKNNVYAMTNLKVKEFGPDGEKNKSLQTTAKTIIFKISENELHKLPPNYQTDPSILALFPKKRSQSQQRTTRSTGIPFPYTSTPTCSQVLQEAMDAEYSPEHPGYFTEGHQNAAASPSNNGVAEHPENPNQNNDIQTPEISSTPSTSKNSTGDSNLLKRSASQCAEEIGGTKRPCANAEVLNPACQPKYETFIIPEKIYDFVNNYERFHVKVKPSRHFLDASTKCYRMRSKPRGRALIINNYHYPYKDGDDDERHRKGSLRDVDNLNDLLQGLGFEVETKSDVSTEELKEILTNFKRKFTNKMDACFVTIFSHGANDLVEIVDGLCVELPNDIIHQFDSKAFPVMSTKPKIIFVQACQNIPRDVPIKQVMPNRRDDLDLENMIVIKASIPGMPAAQDEYLGSHFVYIFVDTVMEYACKADLVAILEAVQYRLKKVRRVRQNVLHCQWTRHHFNMLLYLNPGLYD